LRWRLPSTLIEGELFGLQAKLLRMLEESDFRRVGGSKI
jgi:transcriptional regulator with GAF, ATPase, and Fis domain